MPTSKWTKKITKGNKLPKEHAFAAGPFEVWILSSPNPASGLANIAKLDLSDLDADEELTSIPVKGDIPTVCMGYMVRVVEVGTKQQLLVLGGEHAGKGLSAEVWSGSCADTMVWTQLTKHIEGHGTPTAMAARKNAASVLNGHKLILFGGRGHAALLSDVVVLDVGFNKWIVPSATGETPEGREFHDGSFVAGKFALFFGGVDSVGSLVDTVELLDVECWVWQRVICSLMRKTHFCWHHCGKVYTFGGSDINGTLSTLMETPISEWSQEGALQFVGNPAQYVRAKKSASLQGIKNVFSVEAWINPTDKFPPYATIIANTEWSFKTGWGLVKYGGVKGDEQPIPNVNFFIGNANTKVNMQVDAFKWTHICATYDGATMKLYNNGTLADMNTYECKEEEMVHSNSDIVIGAIPEKSAWDGCIDLVRIWGCARTEQEIRKSMNDTYVGHTSNLLAQWSFNEGADNIAVDSSNNRNHGLLEPNTKRVGSTRTHVEPDKTAGEQQIDENFIKLKKWKQNFEKEQGRPSTKADLLLADKEMVAIARRLGELG